jgi:hypothetical protein
MGSRHWTSRRPAADSTAPWQAPDARRLEQGLGLEAAWPHLVSLKVDPPARPAPDPQQVRSLP